MEQGTDRREPKADVTNAYSWLAVGVAAGSGVGVALAAPPWSNLPPGATVTIAARAGRRTAYAQRRCLPE